VAFNGNSLSVDVTCLKTCMYCDEIVKAIIMQFHLKVRCCLMTSEGKLATKVDGDPLNIEGQIKIYRFKGAIGDLGNCAKHTHNESLLRSHKLTFDWINS